MRTKLQILSEWLCYAVLALLPLQTVYIVARHSLGDTPGIWQYGAVGIYGVDILIVLAVVLWWWVRPQLSMQRMVLTLALSGAIQGCLVLWQVVSGEVLSSSWLGMAPHAASVLGDSVVEASDGRWLRGYGSMPHPNILGVFLSLTMQCAVWFNYYVLKKWRLAWSAVVALNFFGLILSFSRGAWIALGCGLVVMMGGAYLRLPDETRRAWLVSVARIMVVITGVLLVSSILWSEPLGARLGLLGAQRLEQRSIDERRVSLSEGVELWRKKPWLGYGLDQSTVAQYEEEYALHRTHPVYWYQPPHSLYLVVLVEAGLVGLACFLTALFFLLWRSVRGMVNAKTFDQALIGILRCSVVATILSAGAFDHFLWTLHAGRVLWIIVICLVLLPVDKHLKSL